MSRQTDEGFATVAVLALSGVLASVAALVAVLGGVAVVRHQAAATADLAALAAAGHALEGEAAACRVARELARAQQADVSRCGLDGLDVLVEIILRPDGPLGRWGSVRATARAGPAR